MRTAIASLESISPYSPSRAHETEKLNRESHDAYEIRTWREKCHYDDAGNIFIPPMAFKQSLDTAAKMLGIQMPGKGKTTYTKFFAAGVLCMDPVVLPDKKDSVPPERIHAHANGRPGSGTRVWRTFPRVPKWSSDVTFHVFADEITPDVFEQCLVQAGSFVGIGRFRPENRGYFGRFKVNSVKWANC
jgi:hypothetical protein